MPYRIGSTQPEGREHPPEPPAGPAEPPAWRPVPRTPRFQVVRSPMVRVMLSDGTESPVDAATQERMDYLAEHLLEDPSPILRRRRRPPSL